MKLEADTPKWTTAFLICKKCSKRKHGSGVKVKSLSRILRHGLPGDKPRPRVLISGCLGICPKGATAVARIGGGEPRVFSVVTLEQLETALPGL